MSRQLIKRLQKEIEIYKEFLTKTSTTEAKNTETLVKLTEQNRALSTEKSKLEAKSSELERMLCSLKQENSKIEQLKQENSRVMKLQRYNQFERSKLYSIFSDTESKLANSIRQFEDERKCRLKLERELGHMENRLRQQAKAECDAAALQGS